MRLNRIRDAKIANMNKKKILKACKKFLKDKALIRQYVKGEITLDVLQKNEIKLKSPI